MSLSVRRHGFCFSILAWRRRARARHLAPRPARVNTGCPGQFAVPRGLHARAHHAARAALFACGRRLLPRQASYFFDVTGAFSGRVGHACACGSASETAVRVTARHGSACTCFEGFSVFSASKCAILSGLAGRDSHRSRIRMCRHLQNAQTAK